MRSVLKALYLRAFGFFERLGVHVTPVHHTQPIPDTRRLRPHVWDHESELVGIDMRDAVQVALLATFVTRFKDEYASLERRAPRAGEPRFSLDNPYFGPVDAEVLYCLVRLMRPRRILEIGSGHSTLLSRLALARNAAEGRPGRLDTYDPAPPDWLGAIADDATKIHVASAEDLPIETFGALEAGDILFLDSTHVVRIGGDVCYEILEVLPRLRPGVVVHLHDIFLPAQYPRDWIMRERLFWTEQYLLQAFLAFNDAYEVVWGSSYMSRRHADLVAAAFASVDPASEHTGGSFWIRRAK